MESQILQLNLIKAFAYKEKVFWKRSFTMKAKIGWVGFISATIIIIPFHYAFALMHFGFECILWVFNNSQFKANMKRMVEEQYNLS